jgi:UDP-glucose 4-epimerase
MRVLVTGGSGYIGSRICAALAARPHVDEVLVVDLRPPKQPWPAALAAKIRHVERSVTEDLRDLFTGVDRALHLAWVVDPLRDAVKQRQICIGGTHRFLDGCMAGDVKRVFFMSSATSYGANAAHATPVSEDEPQKDQYHLQYSREKREAEEICRRFAADRPGTLLQMARPCVVGGPNVSNFIFRAMDKKVNFRAVGKDPEVQLVHEDDCADAVLAIVESDLPGAFNVAGDDTMRISQTYEHLGARVLAIPLHAMIGIAGAAWRKQWTQVSEAPPEFVFFVAFPWLVSNQRLRTELGWKPRHSARATLDAFLAARKG